VEATLDELKQQLSDIAPIRAVPLAVNAPFHSRYMQPIEGLFKEYLSQFKQSFNVTKLNAMISNYTGGFYPDCTLDTLEICLTKQISGSVKWRENMQHFSQKAKNILEIGPCNPLRGFFKSIGVKIQSINNMKSIEKVFTVTV
jgi:malonyl CoA-acyl carrier protein transacylase